MTTHWQNWIGECKTKTRLEYQPSQLRKDWTALPAPGTYYGKVTNLHRLLTGIKFCFLHKIELIKQDSCHLFVFIDSFLWRHLKCLTMLPNDLFASAPKIVKSDSSRLSVSNQVASTGTSTVVPPRWCVDVGIQSIIITSLISTSRE